MPQSSQHRLATETHTAQWAQQLGQVIAPRLAQQAVLVTLEGELGAGKTSLCRHLLQALGVNGRIKSPSYALVETYALPLCNSHAWHFDFYRMAEPIEFEEAGFRDTISQAGLHLVEWPQKAAGQLRTPDLQLHLEVLGNDSRQLHCLAATPLGQTIVNMLAQPTL